MILLGLVQISFSINSFLANPFVPNEFFFLSYKMIGFGCAHWYKFHVLSLIHIISLMYTKKFEIF